MSARLQPSTDPAPAVASLTVQTDVEPLAAGDTPTVHAPTTDVEPSEVVLRSSSRLEQLSNTLQRHLVVPSHSIDRLSQTISSNQLSAHSLSTPIRSQEVVSSNYPPEPSLQAKSSARSLEVPQGYVSISPGIYVPSQYLANRPSAMLASTAGLSSSASLLTQTRTLANDDASSPTQNSVASEFPRYPLLSIVPTTSLYGMRWGRLHAGVDFGTEIGSSVVASLSGHVIFQGWYGGYGKTVVIQQANGATQTLYGHLSNILVRTGQSVRQGEIIAQSGNTGRSTGPHLHFEIRQAVQGGWTPVDVNQIVARSAQLLKDGQQAARPASFYPTYATRSAASSPTVEMRVALTMNTASLQLASSTPATLTAIDGSTLGVLPALQKWTAQADGSSVYLNGRWMTAPFFIQPQSNGLVQVNNRWYRGRVLVVNRPRGLMAVNWVSLEHYIASVVGSEAFPSWNINALKAQAIAARSYGLSFRYRPASVWYDLEAGPQHQAYNGIAAEFNTTYQATLETQGQVLVSNGGVIEAQYAATQALTDSYHNGFGMSQWGAAALADEGHDYLAILQKYYPGSLISWIQGSR